MDSVVGSERIRSLLEAEGVASQDLFCTVHAVKEDRLAVIYSSHPEPERLGGWQMSGQGIVGKAVDSAVTIRVDDVHAVEGYLSVYPRVISEFALPVFMSERVVGVVNFESSHHDFFSDRVVQFEELASQISRYFDFGVEGTPGADLLIPETSLLTSRDEKQLNIEVAAISDSLLRVLAEDPSRAYLLSPRRFEELVGRILEDLGYSVTITPVQKDGGYDLLAEAKLETGTVLTLVECKKWSSRNPVGVEIVRNLYGVLGVQNVTNAMIVTTSHFTRDARQLQDTIKYRLSLKDYRSLAEWLERYGSRKASNTALHRTPTALSRGRRR